MGRFHIDDRLQKQVRDAVIGPGLYGPFSQDGRYVYIDKGRLATTLQKQYAVDTILQGEAGAVVCVEEKIIRWAGRVYTAITLETKSCSRPGFERDGWMVYGQADFLNYAFCQENGDVLCYLIDFQKLQAAFWPAIDTFPETTTTQRNRTKCRVVPLAWVADNVGGSKRYIHATPDGAEVVRTFNATHYKQHEQS